MAIFLLCIRQSLHLLIPLLLPLCQGLWSLWCWVNVWYRDRKSRLQSYWSQYYSGSLWNTSLLLLNFSCVLPSAHLILVAFSLYWRVKVLVFISSAVCSEVPLDSFLFFCLSVFPGESWMLVWSGCGTTETTSSLFSRQSYSYHCHSYPLHRWVYVCVCVDAGLFLLTGWS